MLAILLPNQKVLYEAGKFIIIFIFFIFYFCVLIAHKASTREHRRRVNMLLYIYMFKLVRV